MKISITKPRLIFSGAVFASGHAHACSSFNIAGLNFFLFAFALFVVAVFIGLLTGVIWLCLRFWIKPKSGVSASFLSLLVVSLVLGIIGVFVIPYFQSLFSDFGAYLPMHTSAIISMRYFLLLPLAILGANVLSCTVQVADGAVHSRYLLITSIILAMVLWSLYAPIFRFSGIC